MIKAILFDFDGTLANTLPYYVKAYDKALKQIGFTYSEREIVKLCFGKKEDAVCKALNANEKTLEFRQAYFEAVKELFKQSQLFDGSLTLLRSLKKRGIKIAIITFAYRWYIDNMIEQFKLKDTIDLIISTDDVIHPKPNPEAVLKACSHFSITPMECMVVGDSKSDIMMAKAAESQSVLIHPPEYELYYNLDDLRAVKPDFVIEKIGQLQHLL